ncbi:MAG: caspase family protein [Candidatus Heimdallarchaeota archaeon]|nr:caspase family protein [Candidatus Heimdallarchaeota archaeon]
MKKKTILFGIITLVILVTTVSAVQAEDTVDKYALIIGISDYKVISDLSFCDEDATDWYNYLSPKGYHITLLGDDSSNYPQWDGIANEINVKNAWATILATADDNDIVAFISSGHGSQINIGPRRRADRIYVQVLCMWDTSGGEFGEDGLIYDSELQSMMAPSVSNTFIFLDHCYAGGMNEVMNNANAAKVYLSTTCTDDGYGYDMSSFANGAWTYYFLEYALIGEDATTLEEAFEIAFAVYPFDGGDTPQEFDGNPAVVFEL